MFAGLGPARLLKVLTARLQAAGVTSAAAEAGQLLEAATGLGRFELLVQQQEPAPEQLAELERLVTRREQREPLQHILGVAHFHGLELQVQPGVLIPRPETEMLVQLALARLRPLESPLVIDVGTGSGAIALAIKQDRPDARVLATDVSQAALDLARRNAAATGLQVELLQADLLDGVTDAPNADMVVSNPPYLPESDRGRLEPEVQNDPALALFAGEDGLDIFRRLLDQCRESLKPGAMLLLELDPRNVRQAKELAGEQHWQLRQVTNDLAGRERFLTLQRSGRA